MASDRNTEQAFEQHGGNMSWLAAHYPQAPQPFIDLSTGINPYAYPLPEMEPHWHCRLPDQAELMAAQAAAARYYAAQSQQIVLAAGMQPLIFALAALRLKDYGPSQISILSPTYEEHRRVWQALGHRIASGDTGDVLILCNPNNPDGKTISGARLQALNARQAARGGWLIIDESFADLMPGLSVGAKLPNVVVLRSCGKFFGLAGLRVSAAIAPEGWAQWLRTATGPWPISTAACRLLPDILADESWIAAMRAQLAQEAAQWRALLSMHFTVIGHTDLFTLAETDHAGRWHDYLAAQGILTRRFEHHSHWLRFGLPHQTHVPRLRAAFESHA